MFRAVWRINVVHIALIFKEKTALFVGRVGAPFYRKKYITASEAERFFRCLVTSSLMELDALRICTEAHDWSLPVRIRVINCMRYWAGFARQVRLNRKEPDTCASGSLYLGSGGRDRTYDQLINSQLLYR